MKNKRVVFMIIIFVIILVLGTVIYFIKKPKETEKLISEPVIYGLIDFSDTTNAVIKGYGKTNTSPKIKESHQFSGYETTNMKIYTKKNICYIEFDLKNVAYTGNEIQMLEITFYNKKGDYYGGTYKIIGDGFKVGESKKIIIEEITDFSNAYDYTIMPTF